MSDTPTQAPVSKRPSATLTPRLAFKATPRGALVTEDDLGLIEKAIRERKIAFRTACRKVGHSPETVEAVLDASPEWLRRIRKARAEAIAGAEDALYKAATQPDDHGRYDVKAQVFFLTNQAPESWRQRVEQVVETRPDRVKDTQKKITPELMEKLKGLVSEVLMGRDVENPLQPAPPSPAGPQVDAPVIEEIPE